MENQNKGQTALITGATDGIGRELARCCAKDGYDVILVARTEETLRALADEFSREYNVKAQVIPADLMDVQQAFRVYDEVKRMNVRVDVLINDAGQGVYGAFTGTDLQRELDIIQLNVSSLVVLTKLFIKEMVARDSGKILQLASIASKTPSPYSAVYAATKAFIYNFTQGIIGELEDSKVTMTALMPGATATDFFRKEGSEHSKLVAEGDLADAADVARDGYEAMQNGDSKVVSGMKNKIMTAMGNFMPDEAIAANAKKQHEPSEKEAEAKH